MTKMTRSAMATTCTVSLLILAGCSGGEDEASKETKTDEDQAVATGQPVGDLQQAPDLEDSVGARKEARFDDCDVEAGEIKVPGQVTNSQEEDQDYVVSVSWIVEGSQVVARGVAEVTDVPAGETEEFEVSAELDNDAEQCTYNVRRAPSAEG